MQRAKCKMQNESPRTGLACCKISPPSPANSKPQATNDALRSFLAFLLLLGLLLLSSCGPNAEMTALIKMTPNQEEYFKTHIVPGFEKKHKCKITVVHYDDMWDVSNLLRKHKSVGLVKTPFEITSEMVNKGDMLSMQDFLQTPDINEIRSDYFLVSLGSVKDTIYYLPRKFECRMLVYLKSKVLDAVNHWVEQRDAINAVLKQTNGYGLPYKYELEADPNLWDYYDVFVAGYYWAHTPYLGRTGPRIGHRGAKYPGTALRLVDRCYQLNAKPDDVLRMNTDPVVDAFEWEALYVKEELYVPRMWKDQWTGGGIWEGFKSGDVFLSFMTQLDCFFIHGTGTKEMPGYLADPNDMGVAVMPKGVSVELDEHGNVIRPGRRAITTGGWWWGIPRTSPDPKLSYQFARWITSTDNQVEECSNFGMVPVRKDILGDISLMFGGGWVTEIFNTAFAQLVENRYTTIPTTPKYGDVGKNYIEAWYDICVGQSCVIDGKLSRKAISKALNEKYVPLQREILGKEYPE